MSACAVFHNLKLYTERGKQEEEEEEERRIP